MLFLYRMNLVNKLSTLINCCTNTTTGFFERRGASEFATLEPVPTVTSVDVLNAIRDQYQAERELQRIRYEHINLLLLLKRETGTLSAEDLLEVGAWLTPAAAQ